MEVELSSLTEQRNSLTWLCHIPRELLESILLQLQIDDDVDAEDKEISNPWWTGLNNDWVHSMSVCRHIREVALACPSLWSYVQIGNGRQKWSKLCLARSGQHLLDLHAFIGWNSQEERIGGTTRVGDLVSRCHRVRLNIRVHDTHTRRVVKDLFNHHFRTAQPHLRHLEIFDFSDDYRPIIRDSFLENQPIRLRSLILTHYWIQSGTDVPPMPLLESLVLRDIKRGPFFDTLHKLLQRTPAVTFLCIEECTAARKYARAASTTDTPAQRKSVSLPGLVTLQLHGSVADLRDLLQILPDPSRELLIYESAHGDSDDFFLDVDIRQIDRPERRLASQHLAERVLQFVRDAVKKDLLARHLVSDYRTITSGNANAWVVHVFSDEDRPASHLRYVDFRLCFAREDRPDPLVHAFPDIFLAVDAADLRKLTFLLCSCAGLSYLNVEDLQYSFRGRNALSKNDERMELVENVMRERARRGQPLQRIAITRDRRYLREFPDQLVPHEHRKALEVEWKSHG